MNKNIKISLIIGGIIIAVLVVLPIIFGAISGWQGYGYGMMGPWMMGGFGWGWFMPVFMILCWGLIIWGIVALVRGVASPDGIESSRQADSALEILKRRYARGEISKEEFEEKKKDLI